MNGFLFAIVVRPVCVCVHMQMLVNVNGVYVIIVSADFIVYAFSKLEFGTSMYLTGIFFSSEFLLYNYC